MRFGHREHDDQQSDQLDDVERAVQPRDPIIVTRAQEELRVGTTVEDVGRVHVRKHIESEHVRKVIPLDVEEATVERVEVDPATDSGEIDTLPDGSISVPVFEEQLVVEKRLVVRERIIIRKLRHTDNHVVDADLRHERVTVDVDDAVLDRVHPPSTDG